MNSHCIISENFQNIFNFLLNFEKFLEKYEEILNFQPKLTKIYSSGTRGLELRARAWSGFAIFPIFRARAYRA